LIYVKARKADQQQPDVFIIVHAGGAIMRKGSEAVRSQAVQRD
jgi:hypothetical protein